MNTHPADQLTTLAQQGDARVERVEVDGQAYWIKRQEILSWRMRMQKGDATKAFEAERAAYHVLAKAQLPVPGIVVEGARFFVTPDCGRPVSEILRFQELDTDTRLEVFSHVGEALWAFHKAGFSHGRPSLKDMCWDGARVRFIDFERYNAKRNTKKGHAEDLVMCVFNAFYVAGKPCAEIDELIARYREYAPDEIWQGAQAWCRKRAWINWATKPIQMRRPGKAKEFKAIPLTLQAFLG